MNFEDGTTFIEILFFARFKKYIIKIFVELPINTPLDLKFSCSTEDEWNLAFNKK